jgi:hypothetical protein
MVGYDIVATSVSAHLPSDVHGVLKRLRTLGIRSSGLHQVG